MLTLPFVLVQLPVLYVDGDVPEWWLWDSHEASALERRSSSWSETFELLIEGVKVIRLGALIPPA